MEALIDYRNGKYQGHTDHSMTRNGFGILIDDDLSFYASHWKDGKLNDSTVIYISHGKYIYGQWRDNQPHGLNVFRIGDTVVLGEFDNGFLVKNIIIIFQKFNFIAILEQLDQQWTVASKNYLKNYNQLVKYIEQANIPMKPQYFSLTKFLTSLSNQNVMPIPCKGSENCYFGYEEGLGIIFNANNGVVSVGSHQNKKLTEFGGKFQSSNSVIQGNFITNQLIRYTKQRPKQQIYSIYQKLHKRSLNFKNEYFDSKVKLLSHIEQLIRAKIQQIMNKKNGMADENTFTALDLNDSLDYHYESLQEINKMNRIRQEVYQASHIPMKKTISQFVQSSPKVSSKKSIPITPVKKNVGPIINAPASPIIMKKSPYKHKQKQHNKQKWGQKKQFQAEIQKTPKRALGIKSQKYQNEIMERQICNPYQNLSKQHSVQQIQVPKSIKNSSISVRKGEELATRSPVASKLSKLQNVSQASPIQQMLVSSKDPIREKEAYNVPSFKYSYPEIENNHEKVLARTLLVNKSDVKIGCSEKLTNYERIQRFQKSQTVLKNQKTANRIQNVEWIETSSGQSGSRTSISPLNKKQNDLSVSPSKTPNYENLSDRRKRLLKQFKNLNTGTDNPGSAITKLLKTVSTPCALTNNNQIGSSYKQQNLNMQFESPCARQKFFIYQSKNTEQSETMLPLTMCKTNIETALPIVRKFDQQKDYRYNKVSERQKSQYYPIENSAYNRASKQNVESGYSGYSAKPFERKQSYYQKPERSQKLDRFQMEREREELTPGKRKTYKYYFEQ